MLQERISELGSGILELRGNKVILTGFMSPERLYDYYICGKDCHFSKGIYDNERLNWGKIQDDALFVLLDENNNEIQRYQFKVMNKNIIKYKDINNKLRSKTYTIRKCKYTNIYNFKSREIINENGVKNTIEDNRLFSTIDELKEFFRNTFSSELEYYENE